MKDRIFAFLQKPDGRGHLRCWRAWRFPVSTTQNSVENFMMALGYDCRHYFIQMESDLVKGKEFPYHYYKADKNGKSYWVYCFNAKVKWENNKKKVSFIITERWE